MGKTIIVSLLILFFTGSQRLCSQVIYNDLPDTSVNTWDFYSVTMSSSPLRSVIIWFHPFSPNQVVVQNMREECDILFDSNGRFPAKLNSNDVIDSTGTWRFGSFDTLNVGGTWGNWKSDATDKYLGFRFRISGQWQYGWIRLSVDQAPTMFTIKSAAYQSQESTAIRAGQTTVTGIREVQFAQPAFSIQDKQLLFRNLQQGKQHAATVYDMKGQQLLSNPVDQALPLDLSACPPGIYIVRLTAPGLIQHYKIAVQ